MELQCADEKGTAVVFYAYADTKDEIEAWVSALQVSAAVGA